MAYERWWRSFLPAATVVIALSVQGAQGGNTTCVSNQLSWYTSVVGESPCMTYQRLRQVCNNDYQVPSFSSTVPGDRCDDQVSECCCNMVAFQLSMLCMVCQQDHEDSGGIGIDAPVKGTYTVYRGTCGAGVNHTLPSDLQSAICNKNIRIDNFLYDSWDDGTWFYVWTKENVEKLHAANNNNTFTHCPDQISPSPTPTPPSTSTTSTMLQTTASPTSQASSPAPVPVSNTANTQAPAPTSGGVESLITITSSAPGSTPSLITSVTRINMSPTSEGASSPSSNSSGLSAPVQTSDADLNAGGQSKSKSRASLIGGIVGGVGGVVAIVVAAAFWRRRKARDSQLLGTHGAGYNDMREARHGTVRPHSLAPNRLGGEGLGTPPAARENDPFMSGSSPRTPGPGTWSSSSAVSPTETQPSAPLTEESLRHRDGGSFGTGLARSDSGRLPPAYDHSWEDTRRRPSHPHPGSGSSVIGSVSAPTSYDYEPGSEVSAGHTHTMSASSGPFSATTGFGESLGSSDVKDRSLVD